MMHSEKNKHTAITPKWAETEDILALLETTKGNTLLDLRDRAIILFLLDTGCRAGELCSLKADDLDLNAMQASVANIGTRARFVFFGESTRNALQSWLDVRPSDRGAWVFVSLATHSKGALTSSSLYRMLKCRGQSSGVQGVCKPSRIPARFRPPLGDEWGQSLGTELYWRI